MLSLVAQCMTSNVGMESTVHDINIYSGQMYSSSSMGGGHTMYEMLLNVH